MTVSVVVPTRNRAGLLTQLLAALDAQDHPDYEVIIVDDASNDDTPQILAAWEGPGRRVLRQAEAAGSYAARNRGWEAARGDIIAFTDDDCLPAPNWLSTLVRSLGDAQTVGVQGATIAGPGEITPFTHQIDQRCGGPPYRTCNIAYRRSLINQLGGFDGTLRWYGDNILGLRARRLGPIAFSPDAVVYHPPRSREWRDVATWRERFWADQMHRRVLHELGVERVAAPGGALPLLLWIFRPLVKQGLPHLSYAVRHPERYRREIQPMLREKLALLQALRSGPAPGPLLACPVSVVIVTKHRPDLLAGTLSALQQQTHAPTEIIVVDNGPDEGTHQTALAAGARYIQAPGTLGYARQAGIEAGSSDIVAFTDDDCLPAPDWLEHLLRAFNRDPQAVGVQGRTVTEHGPILSHGVRVSHSDRLYQTCNIAYRRDAVQRAGGFDPSFAGWFEDTALGGRVADYGPIIFSRDARVIHRALPLTPLDRNRWLQLLRDEQHLAHGYPDIYRQTRGPNVWIAVSLRWFLGSPLKRLLRALPRLVTDPTGYWTLVKVLAGERRELVIAAFHLAREGR